MPAEARRTVRAVLSFLLLLLGALLASSIDRSTSQDGMLASSTSLFDEPRFSIRLGRNQLRLDGTSVSADHEAAFLQLVDEQFADVETQTQFSAAVGVADDWEVLSTRLLYLVAATDSAHAVIDTNGIMIRGTTQDRSAYESRLTFLQDALINDRVIDADVLTVARTSLEALCARNFASLNTGSINFRQSSTSIRRSSYALLDRLAEFAHECRAPKIAISGHSDATGSEPWNLTISRARAQAVADHLIQNGVAPARLIVIGIGSALPIADNESVHGREQNRRIEIELR